MSLRIPSVRALLGAALLLVAASAPALAQRRGTNPADSLVDGRRVRVTLPKRWRFARDARVEGAFRRLEDSAIVLAVGGRDTSIALADARRVELRLHTRPRSRNVLLGAVGGAVTGGTLAFASASMLGKCRSGERWEVSDFLCADDPRAARLKLGLGYASIGAGLGALGGAMVPTRRWESLAHPTRAALTVGPAGVALAVRF